MFISANGVRLYCERAGSGPPVVLLHGNGEDHTIFTRLIGLLSLNFTVYAPDTRGHGRSESAPLDYGEMAEDVAAFIEGLALVRPALYGFSDGGIVGLLVASRRPELLSRLVVSGANTAPSGLSAAFLASVWLKNLFHPDPKLKLMLKQPHISVAELGRISVPVTVLAGQRDVVKARHTRRLAASVPGAETVILRGETHASYVLDNDKLYSVLCPILKAPPIKT